MKVVVLKLENENEEKRFEELLRKFLNGSIVQLNKECKEEDEETRTNKYIKNVLDELGIRKDLRGYNYILEAVKLMMSSKQTLGEVKLTAIYSIIAKKIGVTASSVERNIRSAKEDFITHADANTIKKVFNNSVITKNLTFLIGVTEYVKLQQK